jgi:hypothetical protein
LSLFRRREPLHVRLAREGGMLERPDEPLRAAWDHAGIHGVPRVREWDAVTMVDVPELNGCSREGDRSVFVALTVDRFVVEEGPKEVAPLAIALRGDIAPPYRAEAVRRTDALWAVAARRLEIIEVADLDGNEIELTNHQGERTLLVDGERAFGTVPAFERPEHSVRARRVEGDAWEVEIHPL